MKTAIALLLAFSVSLPLGAVPGRAADMPSAHPAPDEPAPPADYRDDRSTPESLVQSLYNAIDRHEYLRGWSYFSDDSDRPTFDDFAAGYEDTDTVRLKVGEVTSEGAAGSIFSAVPVAIEGTKTDGTTSVFTGCYRIRFVQPANQATPPFRPLQIIKGTLRPSSDSFETAEGSCPEDAG